MKDFCHSRYNEEGEEKWERRPLHLFGLAPKNVIGFLKEELRKGFYVLMYIKDEPSDIQARKAMPCAMSM